MQFGLKENIILGIKNVFLFFPEVEEVVLYGSRAKGNFKAGSDIDLALKGDKINSLLINKISLQLDDLYLPYTIDLSVFCRINNAALINQINHTGISFYRKNETEKNG
jgi:predicted nucleotidyltransferase